MKSTIKLSSSLAFLALLSFSACGGSGGSSNPNGQSSANDVTVERGKVYNATVTDSSTPPQTAKEKEGLNVYTFAKKPTYPVIATGGWIDVNGDGKKDAKDVYLDIPLKSYSNIVTPVTTYIADANKTIRDEKLEKLKEGLNNFGVGTSATVSDADLLGLASKAKNLDVVFLENAIYQNIKENGGKLDGVDENSIVFQFGALKRATTETTPEGIEAYVVDNLAKAGLVNYISQSELSDENATSGISDINISDINISGGTHVTTGAHDFQEATSLDISSGLPAHSAIGLFKNDDANTEIYFTLSKDKSIIQYTKNGQVVWQNASYTCSISGKTITCDLPSSGGLDIGGTSSPQQVILVVDSTTVTAHVSATMNGEAYTVFYAMDTSLIY